jgi:prepilin-type N-terminal cleavage/methylation domain-containing protein
MKGRKGYTLTEVVVAMLLSAVMITSVFTVALSNRQSGLNLDQRLAGGGAAQAVVGILGNYMTADPTQSMVAGPTCLPGPPPACNPGPNSWSLTGNYYSDYYNGTAGSTAWALAPGSHTITGNPTNNPGGLLPSDPTGQVIYFVSWTPASCSTPPVATTCTPQINVTVVP